MNTKIAVQVLIGLTGYGVWAFIAYIDPAQRPDFLKFNITMAIGTIGIVLRDMQQIPPPPPPIPSPAAEPTKEPS